VSSRLPALLLTKKQKTMVLQSAGHGEWQAADTLTTKKRPPRTVLQAGS